MPVFLPMPLATPSAWRGARGTARRYAGRTVAAGVPGAAAGVAHLCVQFAEPLDGQEMVLPSRAHAIRADEFEEGFEVAEDGSGTTGVDRLLSKHLSVAFIGHDGLLV